MHTHMNWQMLSSPPLSFPPSFSLSVFLCLLQRPVETDVDPEDDPNNQGEDEFEEAALQQQKEAAAHQEAVAAAARAARAPKPPAPNTQRRPPAGKQPVVSEQKTKGEWVPRE